MRRRKHKKNITAKIGLLFIVLILLLTSLSVSYAHWEENLEIDADITTTIWPEGEVDPLIAFEDLSICGPGTGTIGYWKNHPCAWPVDDIAIGGNTYTKAQAIAIMKTSGSGDKTYGMFKQLVAAKLNVLLGCELSCITDTITDADNWMALHPVGSNVRASDSAWKNIGGSLHSRLTKYNEGRLCAPHRDDVEDHNDYDYNDFVVDVDVKGQYVEDYLVELNFAFEALARGAAYHHSFHINIPAGTFGTDGEYTVSYYETDGSLLSSATSSFTDFTDIDITIFSNTWHALPPTAGHSYCANAIDGTGIYPGRTTTISFTFTGFFCVNELDLDTYTLDYIGVHVDNLFFDPYLYIWDTGEEIHKGDVRTIIVSDDWIWPQEFAAIWTVYPYNFGTNQGVNPGNPPTFTNHWYTESPTNKKWDP